ncbi:hypothetical protein Ddye_019377 [Dipteronia dyeriana]|uniref:Endonuclease/exonuclease/phosphatase domain-containing protein n=1 Tax=Dipteronia dyeriana TaxID=168575 RepID=A0AAD9TXZ8_9ROSI|nr:hypothetical protein Ddye_019377 [Dipteronia dyeriana]
MEHWGVKLGFDCKIVVNSNTKSGGLCLYWNNNVSVSLVSFSQGHIDVKIADNGDITWRFTGFYRNPDSRDFNEILWDYEKSGVNDKSWHALADFREALEDSNLEDMGFVEFWGSDHRPIVVDFALVAHSKNNNLSNRDRRFFFEECWLEDKECRDIVEAVWKNRELMCKVGNFLSKIEECGRLLKSWNCKKRNNQRLNLRQKRNSLKEVCKGNEGLDWRKVREVDTNYSKRTLKLPHDDMWHREVRL